MGFKRTGLLYDVHIPYHDETAYNLAINYLTNLKPKISQLVLAGDYVDFKDVSFYKTDPDRMTFEAEIELVNNYLTALQNKFKNIPIIYLEGNHEQRLFRYVQDKAPNLSFRNRITDVLGLPKRKIIYISNIKEIVEGRQAFRLGKLYVLHGHEKRVSLGAVNLSRLFYSKCKTNVISGHHHRTDFCLVKKINQIHEGAWSVGTLGRLAEPYLPLNDWNHGFAYVDVYEDGFFEVHNKIIIEGKVING